MAEQSDELAQKAKNGYLFLILYTAGGGRVKNSRKWLERDKVEAENECL